MIGVVEQMAIEVAKERKLSQDRVYVILSAFWRETYDLFRKNARLDGDFTKVTSSVTLPGIGRLYCTEGPYRDTGTGVMGGKSKMILEKLKKDDKDQESEPAVRQRDDDGGQVREG